MAVKGLIVLHLQCAACHGTGNDRVLLLLVVLVSVEIQGKEGGQLNSNCCD